MLAERRSGRQESSMVSKHEMGRRRCQTNWSVYKSANWEFIDFFCLNYCINKITNGSNILTFLSFIYHYDVYGAALCVRHKMRMLSYINNSWLFVLLCLLGRANIFNLSANKHWLNFSCLTYSGWRIHNQARCGMMCHRRTGQIRYSTFPYTARSKNWIQSSLLYVTLLSTDNYFTSRLSSKFVLKYLLKWSITPQTRCYTTLWNSIISKSLFRSVVDRVSRRVGLLLV